MQWGEKNDKAVILQFQRVHSWKTVPEVIGRLKNLSQEWCPTPVIPATQGVRTAWSPQEDLKFNANPDKVKKTHIQNKNARGVPQVVECLPSKQEASGFDP